MILTGLICPSDADNYVLFICYIISFKNHIAIYDNKKNYSDEVHLVLQCVHTYS